LIRGAKGKSRETPRSGKKGTRTKKVTSSTTEDSNSGAVWCLLPPGGKGGKTSLSRGSRWQGKENIGTRSDAYGKRVGHSRATQWESFCDYNCHGERRIGELRCGTSGHGQHDEGDSLMPSRSIKLGKRSGSCIWGGGRGVAIGGNTTVMERTARNGKGEEEGTNLGSAGPRSHRDWQSKGAIPEPRKLDKKRRPSEGPRELFHQLIRGSYRATNYR